MKAIVGFASLIPEVEEYEEYCYEMTVCQGGKSAKIYLS